jgi:integrase
MAAGDGKGTRQPNGASSLYYSEYDGCWHGRVTVGLKDNGSPDRRHIKRKAPLGREDKNAQNQVAAEIRRLENERDTGQVRKPGRAMTVEQWLTHWLENIVRPSVKYKAYCAYRTAVHHHLIPGLGKHRIDKIEPDHFERLYAKILKNGRKPATAHQVHRTARTAFGEALRRGYVLQNKVAFAKPPRVEEEEIEPFEIEDIQRLLKTALSRRNGVRFVLALAIGTRQGETLGLKWSRLDDRTKTLKVARQLQRRTWEHGCSDPLACGAKYHKVKPCKDGCKRHRRKPCPPPCPADCTSHARWCPQKHGGGLVDAEVKSRAGNRSIGLPDPLYELLVRHRAEQARERDTAAELWEGGDWMFAQPNGRPIDPRRDMDEWKALLADAGVREARLHDARHTAATVLLVLGVTERAAMGVMGWSNSAMARRYMHMTDALRQDIAERVGGFLWGDNSRGDAR